MKKNDIKQITITDYSSDGSGIGKADGITVFIPSAAVGDELEVRITKVKKNLAFAKAERIIKPSIDRIEPDCPAFPKCGGCTYRHITYESECAVKQRRVEACIKHIAGIDKASKPIIPSSTYLRYRNKAQYPISEDGRVGFYAPRSHRIIPCDDCLLQPESFALAAKATEKFIKDTGISVYNEETGVGIIRHLYLRASAAGDIMAVLVINATALEASDTFAEYMKSALGEQLKSLQLNINLKRSNVILGDKCVLLYGEEYITDTLCSVDIRLSPLSFYQVNRAMAQRLYAKAAEYAEPDGKIILDLYCGAGAIGLSMAKRAKKIIGVEIVAKAVQNARENADRAGYCNTEFICADAAQSAAELKKRGLKPDAVIVDPPRKGCDKELIKTIALGFAPERLVYISCDPATLARDAALLKDCGYSLIEYTPVDLFPRTAHTETAALFLNVCKAEQHGFKK